MNIPPEVSLVGGLGPSAVPFLRAPLLPLTLDAILRPLTLREVSFFWPLCEALGSWKNLSLHRT